jgi:tripartite-type tricarboxylate transporter receptor subunit TctC
LTAKAPPDGYTIGYGMIGAMAISPNVVAKPPLDVQKDLAPIVQMTTGQMLLAAGNATSFKSVRDLVAYAKQNPGKLNYASSGNGTPGHVGFELFKSMTGTQIVHVPYKGGAAGIADLMAGQVQLDAGKHQLDHASREIRTGAGPRDDGTEARGGAPRSAHGGGSRRAGLRSDDLERHRRARGPAETRSSCA